MEGHTSWKIKKSGGSMAMKEMIYQQNFYTEITFERQIFF